MILHIKYRNFDQRIFHSISNWDMAKQKRLSLFHDKVFSVKYPVRMTNIKIETFDDFVRKAKFLYFFIDWREEKMFLPFERNRTRSFVQTATSPSFLPSSYRNSEFRLFSTREKVKRKTKNFAFPRKDNFKQRKVFSSSKTFRLLLINLLHFDERSKPDLFQSKKTLARVFRALCHSPSPWKHPRWKKKILQFY